MKLEDQQHYESLEEKVDGKAMERFRRPAYQVTDVIGYMARKYDIKGVIADGNRREQCKKRE